MAIARRGDIWLVQLDPTQGAEQQARRPVLVMSEQAFNRSGMVLVCPITQGGNQARNAGFAVTLMGAGTQTQGAVMCNQARTLDLIARKAAFIENAGPAVASEALSKLQTIID